MDKKESEYIGEMIKRCVHKKGRGVPDTFFQMYLHPFFGDDPDGGISPPLGHFIYRLSDYIPKGSREMIFAVRASSPDPRAKRWRNDFWFDLEVWRTIWEEKNGDYPIPMIVLMNTENLLENLPEFLSLQNLYLVHPHTRTRGSP